MAGKSSLEAAAVSVWPAAPRSRGPVLHRASSRRRARHGHRGRRLLTTLVVTLLLVGTAGLVAQSQNTVPERVIRDDLDRQGLGRLALTFAGRDVHVSGVLPPGVSPDFAQSLAQGATCRFFLLARPCASRVTVDLQTAARPAERTAAVPERSTASDAPAAATPAVLPGAVLPTTVPTAGETCAAVVTRLAAEGPPLQFPIRSAELLPGAQGTLDRIARAMASCAGRLQIEGHTDARGPEADNRALSQARASAVRAALISRGVPPDRLSALGLGSRRPRFDNETADGRRNNRRIEFVPGSTAELAAPAVRP